MRAPFLLLLSLTLTAALRVDSVNLTVSDLDRSLAFYTQVLHFEQVSEVELHGEELEHLTGVFGSRIRRARLRLGSEFLELTEFLAPQGRPAPTVQRSNDLWFQHIAIITPNMDRAYQHLRAHKVRHASSGPQTLPAWNPNAGGIQAFYFRDPDGHALEILSFPPDKGDPKWRQPSDRLFLGIDHTAIVVADTASSLAFYRDLLGLKVAGASENHGPEQERLNNVFGARLRITTLRAESGPGIEFLEYLAPSNGRLYPSGAQPNDLIHVQTRLAGDPVEPRAAALRRANTKFLSSRTATFDGIPGGPQSAILVRDPDGHAIEIAQ